MTEPLSFSGHPKAIATVLKNVVTTMSEPGASSKPGPVPYVQIVVESPTGPTEGILRATGVGLYMGATDSTEIESEDSDRRATVRVLAKNTEKTDVVDDLWKLAMAIQRTSTAKDARVHLSITDRQSISASFGEEFLGELGDMDPESQLDGDEDSLGFFEAFEGDLWETISAPETERRLAYSIDLISRLKDVRPSEGPTIADFKVHPERTAVAVAVGPSYRALYAGIEREGFASGGPWHDGPGNRAWLIP